MVGNQASESANQKPTGRADKRCPAAPSSADEASAGRVPAPSSLLSLRASSRCPCLGSSGPSGFHVPAVKFTSEMENGRARQGCRPPRSQATGAAKLLGSRAAVCGGAGGLGRGPGREACSRGWGACLGPAGQQLPSVTRKLEFRRVILCLKSSLPQR